MFEANETDTYIRLHVQYKHVKMTIIFRLCFFFHQNLLSCNIAPVCVNAEFNR